MLPEGRYRARGTEAVAGVNKNGKDYVSVAFRVLEGAHEGAIVEDVFYLSTEKNAAITIQRLQAAGATFDKGDVTDLTGFGDLDVEITVGIEVTPSGQERQRIQYVGEPGAGRGRPLEVSEQKAMASRWASVVKQVRRPVKRRDEVPF